MGNVIRYDRAPGESLGMVELPEGHCVVIGNTSVGDPVWLPPELGGDGETRRIAEIKRAACPNRDCGFARCRITSSPAKRRIGAPSASFINSSGTHAESKPSR